MNFDANRLYELLPALYRQRDADVDQSTPDSNKGGPLKALLSILAEQIGMLEEDIDQLYDDQFIETCAEWVVPYIGDLVGARGLTVFPNANFSQRGQAANILDYRQRKGTASVLEQLARDVTGWNARVVEYFQLLATTQYLNHLRPENLAMAQLSKSVVLEYLHTPFDTIPRTVDVRRIERKRGQYNIANIGLFVWRLTACPLTNSPAFRVDSQRYTFDALGKDTPLYNRPKPEEEGTHLAEPINVPIPLSRRVLDWDLRDNALKTYYGTVDTDGNRQSLLIRVDGRVIDSSELTICTLSNLTDASGTVIGWANSPVAKIALDPVLGRLAFPAAGPAPASVLVSYHYGFSMNMGGGEYGRAETFMAGQPPVVRVPADAATLQQALALLLAQLAAAEAAGEESSRGVIEIQDNRYYIETPVFNIPAGKKIELRAADEQRPVLVLSGDFTVTGGVEAEFSVNGLLISGGRIYLPEQNGAGRPNELNALHIQHCTLPPGDSPAIGPVATQPAQPRLVVLVPAVRISIEQAIVGSLRVTDQATVSLSNSIVDAGQETGVAFAGPDGQGPGAVLTSQNSTLIGKVHTRLMTLASNTIFLADLAGADAWPAPVRADRLQQGCVRFSYLPPTARVPHPYRCQSQTNADALRVRPAFTSLRYGDAGYGQLSEHCTTEIKQGADDGAEMGVFHNLYQPQREANLRARLDEFLPFGLEAGIFYGS